MNFIFPWIEYSLIPIAVIVFNKAFQGLTERNASSTEKEMEAKNIGIEIMLILSMSSFLYAVSLYAHSPNDNSTEKDCIISALILGIIQILSLILITSQVKTWGKLDKRSKQWPNRAAIVYAISLMTLIYFCQNHISHQHTEHLAVKVNTNIQSTNLIKYIVIASAVFILCVLIFATFYFYKKISSKKRKDLWQEILKLKDNSPVKVEKLNKLIKTSLSNSIYIIYAYQKLMALYTKLNRYEDALATFNELERTDAYNSTDKSVYLIQSILYQKCDILISLALKNEQESLLDEAEEVIETLNNVASKTKFEVIIAEARRTIKKALDATAKS